ncbi:MAG: hypothetical protein ACHQSE_01595 [Gemmatimonadales bacterium]
MRSAHTRRALAATAATLFCSVSHTGAAQDSPVPVVAVGEGRTFTAALSSAVRMAVEAGAGATVAGAASSSGERLVSDSVRTVSRGVVTRYALIDSSRGDGSVRVRILAMVSPIAERDAVGARASRVAAQGDLWSVNAALDAARRRDEGNMLAQVFGATDSLPSPYRYEIETGPPVPDGPKLRLRLRLIRSPAPAYSALRDRARALLAAIAGPAGVRTGHLPPVADEQADVRVCVSHCARGERRLLNARAALDDTDSLGAFDPPVITAPGATPVPTLFPALPTVGGFAVAFTDSSNHRRTVVHVRSTRGYLAVAGYLRATFDDARFRLEAGDRAVDVLQAFRSPRTGQPAPRFEASAAAGSAPLALARGFTPRTSGGPGAPTSLGSPYVVLTVPAADDVRADTAYVDLLVSPAELAGITAFGISPLGVPQRGAAQVPVTRSVIPAPRMSAIANTAQGTTHAGPPVPAAVLNALSRAPLADGDGALSPVAGIVVAVGSAAVSPAAPSGACAVARLRAQRELVRFISGSHLEGRIGLTTSETRGSGAEERFHEEISETVAGRMAGAALAAQWTAPAPARCRVALWLTDSLITRRDSTDRTHR